MRRLVFVIAAAMVPAALLAFLLIGYDYYQRERARLTRDSLATARALSAAVNTELLAVQAALRALATSPHLASGNLAAFHAQALSAMEDQTFVNVVLVDDTGRHLANTYRPFGAPLPAPPGDPGGLRRVFESGAPHYADLFQGRLAGSYLVGVAVPVRIGGKVRYGLGAGLSPTRFSALLKEQQLPSGWLAVVLDASGTIIARTHDEARLVGQKGSGELVRRSRQALEGTFASHTVEGIPVLTVFRRSPVSGWTVAIGIPQRELMLDLALSLARVFVVGFIALVVALVLAFLIGRRALRPDEA